MSLVTCFETRGRKHRSGHSLKRRKSRRGPKGSRHSGLFRSCRSNARVPGLDAGPWSPSGLSIATLTPGKRRRSGRPARQAPTSAAPDGTRANGIGAAPGATDASANSRRNPSAECASPAGGMLRRPLRITSSRIGRTSAGSGKVSFKASAPPAIARRSRRRSAPRAAAGRPRRSSAAPWARGSTRPAAAAEAPARPEKVNGGAKSWGRPQTGPAGVP